MIIAFGFKSKKGVPPNAKVFDIRKLTHKTDSPEFQDKVQEIRAYAEQHPTETIAIGCEHGKHRSVLLADKVSKAVKRSVYYRDNDRWLK